MFKDVIFNAKGVVRRFILNCDVPITVYFVLLTVNRLARLVPILVKKKLKTVCYQDGSSSLIFH